MDESTKGSETIKSQDVRSYEKYRRRGGLYQPFGKLDASALQKPVFPPRSEGGCDCKKDGCDDSLKCRFPPRTAPPKQALMVEDSTVE